MLNRGKRASAQLFFDGSASPNPGPGGWGAVISMNVEGSRREYKQRCMGKLGYVSNNGAEYFGLISGVRALIRLLQLHDIRHTCVNLVIHGDSKVVINQMTGKYKVRSAKMELLYEVARGVTSQFLSLEYKHVPREENFEADQLAAEAREGNRPNNSFAIYYPSLMRLVDVWVLGNKTLGSSDFGTAGSDPSFFIDARYLSSLPGIGKHTLRNLRDPHPLTFTTGKVDMNVLGIANLDIGVAWSRKDANTAVQAASQQGYVDVVVVDSFPVPVHVSSLCGAIALDDTVRFSRGGPLELDRFRAENFPPLYHDHPYWNSDICFIGIEA